MLVIALYKIMEIDKMEYYLQHQLEASMERLFSAGLHGAHGGYASHYTYFAVGGPKNM